MLANMANMIWQDSWAPGCWCIAEGNGSHEIGGINDSLLQRIDLSGQVATTDRCPKSAWQSGNPQKILMINIIILHHELSVNHHGFHQPMAKQPARRACLRKSTDCFKNLFALARWEFTCHHYGV